jgi:exodeoxyribonuclease VII large subunit
MRLDEANQEARIWSVSDLNRNVRQTLERSYQEGVWVRGEISNFLSHRSGHVYFSLKDKGAQVRVVFLNGAGVARNLKLDNGQEVEVRGRVSLYEVRGEYQLNASQVRRKGLGELQQRFEALKAQLQAEGLFEASRKRPIPSFPRCVGVITSPQGAALQDFLQIIRRRFPGLPIRIYPAAVQGAAAAPEVVRGLQFLNRTQACEVIVVCRGGGSLEDLWAFNEESVARAVAASAIPVISAVGHEVDFSICDFVADLRAPTPSAAAELVIRPRAEFVNQLDLLGRRLEGQMQTRLQLLRSHLTQLRQHYALRQPMTLVHLKQQRVDELALRLSSILQRRLESTQARLTRLSGHYVFREPVHLLDRHRQRLSTLTDRLVQALDDEVEASERRLGAAVMQLRALDPHQVLARGYAILLDDQGRAVTDASQTKAGALVQARLHRGELELRVQAAHADEAASEAASHGQ